MKLNSAQQLLLITIGVEEHTAHSSWIVISNTWCVIYDVCCVWSVDRRLDELTRLNCT